MTARTLLYELMVASPVILLASIGVHARTYEDPFVMVQSSEAADAQLMAFAEPVRMAEREFGYELGHFTLEGSRKVGKEWVRAFRAGEIGPLVFERNGDSVREGPKALVMQTADRLAAALIFGGEHEMAQSRRSSVDDILLGYEVAAILKFSDLHSLGRCSMRQRSALRILMEHAEDMGKAERRRLAAALRRIPDDPRSLERITRMARAFLTLDVAQRWTERKRDYEHPLMISAFWESEAEAKANRLIPPSAMLADDGDGIERAERFARRAFEGQRQQLAELLQILDR
ncbi:MAG: hypothetical protein SNJ74_07760 [Fimbriimonadaceae bacterium]